ncbi:ABC transporter ATP-binding protein [Neobacillus rhizophilus]|uniref:ABC transporter ATP-binding protein n=1 Tax=Neobacillus rhizophilus TaxID=2833579 RepID=A0A942U8P1_9BACI|nr:ABC transporter ATP-binding protein [Neobacillus rhizophilus]MBS4214972.1 ABC transporter ATP-binding protein [Neobacillus rhizophilus]
MLRIEKLNSYYGTSHVLHNLSIMIKEGQGVALIGRNGAGKSSTMKSIMGLMPRVDGDITFAENPINKEKTHKRVRMGIGYVPEDRRIYKDLTVEENITIAANAIKKVRKPLELNEVWENFPLLKDLRKRKGSELSGGEQQILSIARSVVGRPKLILLDEPTEGIAPIIVQNLKEVIKNMIDQMEVAVLLAEQNIKFTIDLTDYVYVIDNGQIVYSGSSEEFKNREDLHHKFLGVSS